MNDALKIAEELDQKQKDHHRREALLNMSCDYNEHDELTELIRQQLIKEESQDRGTWQIPTWVKTAKEVIERLDHYDIELHELNKKLVK